MALITGQELERVISLFKRRGVSIYHACQLIDFQSYAKLGGVPSRALLESSRLPFTKFDTDATDRSAGVWTHVFANLSDFGLPFAMFEWKRGPIPNPFGPILLLMNPRVLESAADVAICLRSAGARGFDRNQESLSTADEVERLFANAYSPEARYGNDYIKFSDRLKREFPEKAGADRGTMNPELSCAVEGQLLSFEYLKEIVVDDYRVSGGLLIDQVKSAAVEHGVRVRISPRRYKSSDRTLVLQDVTSAIEQGIMSLQGVAALPSLSGTTNEWLNQLREAGSQWQFDRYIRYLAEGTMGREAVPARDMSTLKAMITRLIRK